MVAMPSSTWSTRRRAGDRKSTRLNSSHVRISYAVFCLTKKNILPAFFFFNDTATTEIYTLSLHDALPILVALVRPKDGLEAARRPGLDPRVRVVEGDLGDPARLRVLLDGGDAFVHVEYAQARRRSEEHTSELQSRPHLVCRLLLDKKKYTTCLFFF